MWYEDFYMLIYILYAYILRIIKTTIMIYFLWVNYYLLHFLQVNYWSVAQLEDSSSVSFMKRQANIG